MTPRYIQTQIEQDLKLISRDNFLRLLLFVPIFTGIILRAGFQFADGIIFYGIDLSEYFLLMTSFVFAMVMPSLLGMITGFLLLDEKDEGTLTILKVTPLQPSVYLRNKMLLPSLIGIVISTIGVLITGIPIYNYWFLLMLMIMGSLLAPSFALILGTFAKNKVQGLALVKLLGVVFILPLIAYFVPDPLQWIFGLFPVYWPVKLFWMMEDNISTLYLVIPLVLGFSYNFLTIKFLLRLFERYEN